MALNNLFHVKIRDLLLNKMIGYFNILWLTLLTGKNFNDM